jgi:hypothetical protein
MFSQEVLDKVGRMCGRVVVVQLQVTSLPQCGLLAPHRTVQPTESFDVVHLVNV